jgi:hypothetical protein
MGLSAFGSLFITGFFLDCFRQYVPELQKGFSVNEHYLTRCHYVMGQQKHFTTKTPRTLFSVSQMATLANVARATVSAKWHKGEILATALDARSKPLFDSRQAVKIKDARFKSEENG